MLPRVLSVFLVRLYTSVFEDAVGYGQYTFIYSYIAIFNVLLAYGMETAFFRFYNSEENRNAVKSTSLISLFVSSIAFLGLAFVFKDVIAELSGIPVAYIKFTICILVLDALVVIPFALLRAQERPIKYSIIKILNVCINLGLNVFFLWYLPQVIANNGNNFVARLYIPDFEIHYIFISNLIASGVTLLILLPTYFRTKLQFSRRIWSKMIRYATPVMIAGVAFTINEVFDKILLKYLLHSEIAEAEVGKYGACYKLALFMTLFGTAFRMGVEPFFFSHAKNEAPQKTYAEITKYFALLGSLILVVVVVYLDVLARILIAREVYFEALPIVPIILLASFCLGIYHNLSVWYKITDRTRFGAIISTIGAIITLLINFLFIPKIGYMASAIATLAAYGTMMLLSYALGRKYYPIPYDLKRIGLFMGLSVVFAATAFYGFNRDLMVGSLLLLVFLGLILAMERKNIKIIIQKK